MSTYTSTLPDKLLFDLSSASKEFKIPKNRIIEKALSIYLHELKRAAYIQSFKRASNDPDNLVIAEEGMTDYLQQLNDWDETM